MAVVVNVPRDERYSELGEGLGTLIGTILGARQGSRDQEIYQKVASGELSVDQATPLVTKSFIPELSRAAQEYRAANPSQDYIKIDEATGKATDYQSSRTKPTDPGFVAKEVAAYNKKPSHAPTDKSRAVTDLIATDGANWGIPESVTGSKRKQTERVIARNVLTIQDMNAKEDKKLSAIGRWNGEDQVRSTARLHAYNGYATGTGYNKLTGEPFELITNKGQLTQKANEYAAAVWKDVDERTSTLGVQTDDPQDPSFLDTMNSTLQEWGFGPTSVRNPATGETVPITREEEETDIATPVPTPLSMDQPAVAEPAPNTVAHDTVRYQQAVQAVNDAGMQTSPDYGVVDIGPDLPMVPEDVMIAAKQQGYAEAIDLYRAFFPEDLSTVPTPLLQQRIQQNMHKKPASFATAPMAIPTAAPAPVPVQEPVQELVEGLESILPTDPVIPPNQRATAPNEATMQDVRNFMRQNLNSIPAVTPEQVIEQLRAAPNKEGKIILDPSQQEVAEFIRANGLGTFQVKKGSGRNPKNIIEVDPDWQRVFEFWKNASSAPIQVGQ